MWGSRRRGTTDSVVVPGPYAKNLEAESAVLVT